MALSKDIISGDLVFPDELGSGAVPIMQFICNTPRQNYNDSFMIFLPMPQNLQFADAATYGDAELNTLGGAVAGLSAAAKSGGLAGATNYMKGLKGNIPSSLSELVQLGASAMPQLSQSVQQAVSIGTGTTLNKNINTEFTGMSTRRFQFAFKFMAKSKSESATIRNISRAFRIGLYAEGNILQLKYPPTWSINFLDGSGAVLEYIPKIYECYLETLNVSYNQSANVWFSDGAPLECDLALTFIETRALTAEDIKSLDDEPFVKSVKGITFDNFDASTISAGRDTLNSGPEINFNETRIS